MCSCGCGNCMGQAGVCSSMGRAGPLVRTPLPPPAPPVRERPRHPAHVGAGRTGWAAGEPCPPAAHSYWGAGQVGPASGARRLGDSARSAWVRPGLSCARCLASSRTRSRGRDRVPPIHGARIDSGPARLLGRFTTSAAPLSGRDRWAMASASASSGRVGASSARRGPRNDAVSGAKAPGGSPAPGRRQGWEGEVAAVGRRLGARTGGRTAQAAMTGF